MGLFNQFKQALTRDNIRRGLDGAAQNLRDAAADPAGAIRDAATVNDYGRELQRLQREGILGSGVIVSVVPTGEAAASGVDWADVEIEMSLPGRERYIATDRIMVPRVTADLYAPGTRHNVAVDRSNPNKFAFAE